MDSELLKLGQKVSYCSIKAGENAQPDELINGTGIIKGLIIDPNGRMTVNVRDDEKKLSHNLEPFCINPTEGQKIEYYTLRQKINDIASNHNAAAIKAYQEQIEMGTAEIDRIVAELCGPPFLGKDGEGIH